MSDLSITAETVRILDGITDAELKRRLLAFASSLDYLFVWLEGVLGAMTSGSPMMDPGWKAELRQQVAALKSSSSAATERARAVGGDDGCTAIQLVDRETNSFLSYMDKIGQLIDHRLAEPPPGQGAQGDG